MSKKIYGITVATPLNPKNVNPEVPEEQIASSVAAYMDENPITPSGIGARPDTWTPTAEDVGARPDTWMPSASEVGARPDTWLPTLAEIGAAPAGYGLGENARIVSTKDELDAMRGSGFFVTNVGVVDDYSGWWGYHIQQEDGRFITQKVFTYNGNSKERTMWDGVWQPWVDTSPSAFAPSGYGYGGESVPVISGTEDELNAQFLSIINGMSNLSTKQIAFECNSGTLYGKGRFIGTIYKDDNNYSTINATTYFNNHTVRKSLFGGTFGSFEWVNPHMVAGVEYRTTERWNGKAVYTRLFHTKGFTTAASVTVTGATGIVRMSGIFTDDGGLLIYQPQTGIFYSYQYNNYLVAEISLANGKSCTDSYIQVWYIKE